MLSFELTTSWQNNKQKNICVNQALKVFKLSTNNQIAIQRIK